MKSALLITLFLAIGLSMCSQHTTLQHGFGPSNVTTHFGYMTATGSPQNGSHLFYWMFEARENPETAPLVLWLTGGPGCSSELALLFENGPFEMDTAGQLQLNPYSWNQKANLLYVDNPVGTGYSYADDDDDYVVNEKEMAAQLGAVLVGFLEKYPQYKGRDFYVTGESYGGHYIPAIGHWLATQAPQIPLKGIAIGNGWVHPQLQYKGYPEFAHANNLVDSTVYDTMMAAYDVCYEMIEYDIPGAMTECMAGCLEPTIALNPGMNVYNIKAKCVGELCYDFSNITKYLNSEPVRRTLGVTREWQTCNMAVHAMLTGDWDTNLEVYVPTLMAKGKKVLIYEGKLDYMCNYAGARIWTAAVAWPEQQKFNDLPLRPYVQRGKTVGAYKSLENFHYIEIDDAGHMVPHDQPAVALDMINAFIGV